MGLEFGIVGSKKGFAQCTELKGFATSEALSLGWSRGGTSKTDRSVRTLNADACDARTKGLNQQFSAMLASAGDANQQCLTECSFDRNDDLIAEVKQLPNLPFGLSYYYDPGGASFGSAVAPGLYVALAGAQSVNEIRFYKDQEQTAFGMRTNAGAANVVVFLDLASFTGSAVRVEATTVKGNTYVVSLPKIAPL